MIAGVIIVGITGVVLAVIGYLIWKKERISLLHDYHYDKVSEEDKSAFCRLSGMGIISISIGVIITAVLLGITDSALSFSALAAGFIPGIILLVYSGNKYNK